MDPKTLGIAVNAVSFGLTLLAVLLWMSGKMYAGFGRWTLGRALAALVAVLSIYTGGWPPSIAILSTVTVGIYDSILILQACREFMGMQARNGWIYTAGACIYLVQVYSIGALGSFRAGYIESNLFGAAFSVASAAAVLGSRGSRQTGHWITGLSFSAASIAYLVRGYYYLSHSGGGFLQTDTWNTTYLLFLLLWLIAVNFGFFLMHYERLLKDSEAQAALTERASGEMAQLRERGKSMAERARMEQEKSALEVKLAQAQKMEAIGCLAGGVAHDFNNLLTVINGYSRLTLKKLAEGDPLLDDLAEIRKAGERAAGLTRQLLAFSRKQILQPCTLDLNHVLNEMRSMIERLVGEDVEVCVSCGANSLMVRADVHQVEQVIMNLAVNARDAMPKGGRLLFETAGVEREDGANGKARLGRYAMLSVGDTGEGMDAETVERIFEPFFTTKEVGKGTGLGLSMVQGIVSQSGGRIDVRSEPGMGTTFNLYLPRVADAEAEERAPAAALGLEGKETVLVVEDQAEVRKYVVNVLGVYGYRVIPAENADEALSLCKREHIDLVLSDVVMPKVSGRELADRLETLQPGIKVLFMSGYAGKAIEHYKVWEEGVEFIQKPFGPEELAGKIRGMLGRAATPGAAARILVADDEPGVRGFLRNVLKDDGYEVIEAADGKQALRKARAENVDLIVVDLRMPGPEGSGTIQALRKELPGVGIIAISGAFAGGFLNGAMALGADAALSKPVSAEDLLAQVAKVLKARTVVRSVGGGGN